MPRVQTPFVGRWADTSVFGSCQLNSTTTIALQCTQHNSVQCKQFKRRESNANTGHCAIMQCNTTVLQICIALQDYIQCCNARNSRQEKAMQTLPPEIAQPMQNMELQQCMQMKTMKFKAMPFTKHKQICSKQQCRTIKNSANVLWKSEDDRNYLVTIEGRKMGSKITKNKNKVRLKPGHSIGSNI